MFKVTQFVYFENIYPGLQPIKDNKNTHTKNDIISLANTFTRRLLQPDEIESEKIFLASLTRIKRCAL